MNKWLTVGLLNLSCWAQNSGFLTFTNPSNPTVKATELLDNYTYGVPYMVWDTPVISTSPYGIGGWFYNPLTNVLTTSGNVSTIPGVDPTGVNDSTAAIQAALTANPGKILTLPPGVITISNTLNVSNTTKLAGSGWPMYNSTGGTIIRLKAGTSVTAMISTGDMSPTANFETWYLENLTLDANASNGSSVTESVVRYQKVFNSGYIKNVYVTNYSGGGSGIWVGPGNRSEGAGAVRIENVWVNPGSNNIGIKVTSYYPTTLGTEGYINGLTITGGSIENTGNQPAIFIDSLTQGNVRTVWVNNVFIGGVTGTGIVVKNSVYSNFSNILLTYTTGLNVGISFDGNCFGNTVNNLSIPGGYTHTNAINDLAIGLTTPNTEQNIASYIQANNLEGASYIGKMRMGVSTAGNTSLTSTGNVGFGTTVYNPTAPMQVNGIYQTFSGDVTPQGFGMSLGFSSTTNNYGWIQTFSKPLYLNPLGNSVSINGGSSGKATCFKANNVIGYCSTAVDASGNCTCN